MPDKDIFPLTIRLTAARLEASRFTVALAAFLPAFLVFLGSRDSCGTAMKFFLFFFPYVFLVAAQDMAGTEISSGALENILFLRGVFRRYLWRKNFALAAAAGAYAAAVFVGLALWSLARGRFDPSWGLQFGLGLLAGFYYIVAAGALSYVLKGGANVVVILLAQAAALLGLLFSATSRSAFIDHLDAGKFPDLVSRLKFLGFTAVFPNLIVSPRLRAGALVAAGGLLAALGLQRAFLRRLELRKEGRA
jgi:hypothetical protein